MEYVTESPETLTPAVAEQLQESMEEAGRAFCHIIPLKATAEVTKEWKH